MGFVYQSAFRQKIKFELLTEKVCAGAAIVVTTTVSTEMLSEAR